MTHLRLRMYVLEFLKLQSRRVHGFAKHLECHWEVAKRSVYIFFISERVLFRLRSVDVREGLGSSWMEPAKKTDNSVEYLLEGLLRALNGSRHHSISGTVTECYEVGRGLSFSGSDTVSTRTERMYK